MQKEPERRMIKERGRAGCGRGSGGWGGVGHKGCPGWQRRGCRALLVLCANPARAPHFPFSLPGHPQSPPDLYSPSRGRADISSLVTSR